MAKFTLTLCAVGAVILLLESVLRSTLLAPAMPHQYADHSVLGHINRADYTGTVQTDEFCTQLSINSMGCRGPDVMVADILIIGDSFTFAQQVPYDSTWPALLQRRLGVIVLNAGVNNYGPQQELDWLRIIGARTYPQVVIVQMFDNDVTDITRTWHLPTWIRTPLRWSALYRFTKHRLDLLRHDVRNNDAALFYSDAPEVQEGWKRIATCYAEMQLWCKAHNAAMLAVYVPHPVAFKTHGMDGYLQASRFVELMLRLRISYVNGNAVFAEHPHPATLYFPVDGHLTAEGNALLAQAVSERFKVQ